MRYATVIVLLSTVILVACLPATPAPPTSTPTTTPTQTATPTPIPLPLSVPSTNWNFVIQEAHVHMSLTEDTNTVKPKNGAFLVLIGDLENNGASAGCMTTSEWELTNSNTGKEYDYNFYAEPIAKRLYNLDAPGVFFGTCLDGGEKKRVFVVFDVDPTAELTLTFRKSNGGQPVQLHTALSIGSAPTPTPTSPPTPTDTPIPIDTPIPTNTSTPSATPAPETATAVAAATQTALAIPTFTSSPVPPRYVPIVGRIWSGVKVYYGAGAEKAYGFEILGGSESCPSMPSGRGIKVRYPDGTEEWKDREYIVSSGFFYVLEDDPATSALQWYVFNDCP